MPDQGRLSRCATAKREQVTGIEFVEPHGAFRCGRKQTVGPRGNGGHSAGVTSQRQGGPSGAGPPQLDLRRGCAGDRQQVAVVHISQPRNGISRGAASRPISFPDGTPQNATPPSTVAVARIVPSGRNASAVTSLACSVSFAVSRRCAKSQSSAENPPAETGRPPLSAVAAARYGRPG